MSLRPAAEVAREFYREQWDTIPAAHTETGYLTVLVESVRAEAAREWLAILGKTGSSDVQDVIATLDATRAQLAEAKEVHARQLEIAFRTRCRACVEDVAGPDGTARHSCDNDGRQQQAFADVVSAYSSAQARLEAAERVVEAARALEAAVLYEAGAREKMHVPRAVLAASLTHRADVLAALDAAASSRAEGLARIAVLERAALAARVVVDSFARDEWSTADEELDAALRKAGFQ